MALRAVFLLPAFLVIVAPVPQAFADKPAGREDIGILGAAVKLEALAKQRGGQEVTNSMEVNAKLYDNRAVDTISGNNVISDGAFSHANGVPIAIQNSGNNVVIQNSLILNLQLK